MPKDTNPHPFESDRSRLGFHYFPDTVHYRESDLRTWLPELKKMGAAWLTLCAPPDRAIPEIFLRGLMRDGIEPILHFHLPLSHQFQDGTLGCYSGHTPAGAYAIPSCSIAPISAAPGQPPHGHSPIWWNASWISSCRSPMPPYKPD